MQIDTISVINRSHHHTFWTRVPSYTEDHLDALQKEGRILEYWTHAAAYLPMHAYRFCLPYMHAVASGQKHWRRPDKEAMQAVLARIRAEGPLRTRDLEGAEARGNEWGWNCFVPPDRRQFGYYCLPILYGSDIVGRLDPKADRRSGQLIVKALYMEKPVRDEGDFGRKLVGKLWELAAFNKCNRIRYRPHRKDALNKLLVTELTGKESI